MNHDKLRNWSEGRGQYDDITHGLGEGNDDVNTTVAKRGVILLADCQNCGYQHKSVIPWGEVAIFFIADVAAAQRAGAKLTRQGVFMMISCRCNKAFPMLVEWHEVGRWVDMGIRSGALKPEILRARRR